MVESSGSVKRFTVLPTKTLIISKEHVEYGFKVIAKNMVSQKEWAFEVSQRYSVIRNW